MTRPIPTEWITAPLLLIALVAAWQIYVTGADVSAFILPPPAAVGAAFIELLEQPSTWRHTAVTAWETFIGFLLALLIGVSTGLIVGHLRWLERTLDPFIVASQVMPKVALAPLFVIWFGFGPTSKIVLGAMLAFFPIFANTLLGVKSVDSAHRDVMLTFGAPRRTRFRLLDLPSAAPAILAGAEVGIVLSIVGCVVGEFLGGNSGLGYLLVARMNAYRTDSLFAILLLLTALGLAFHAAVRAVRFVLVPWQGEGRKARGSAPNSSRGGPR